MIYSITHSSEIPLKKSHPHNPMMWCFWKTVKYPSEHHVRLLVALRSVVLHLQCYRWHRRHTIREYRSSAQFEGDSGGRIHHALWHQDQMAVHRPCIFTNRPSTLCLRLIVTLQAILQNPAGECNLGALITAQFWWIHVQYHFNHGISPRCASILVLCPERMPISFHSENSGISGK